MANRTPPGTWPLAAALTLLVLAAPSARAQCECQPATPLTTTAPVYSAAPQAMPTSVDAPQRGRLRRRVVDLLIDPVAALRGRPEPSNARALDAAPNAVSAGLTVAYIAGASVSAGIYLGVPIGLRAGRVLVAGPPAAAHDRRETLLWIAEPTLLTLKQRRERRLSGGVFYGER